MEIEAYSQKWIKFQKWRFFGDKYNITMQGQVKIIVLN